MFRAFVFIYLLTACFLAWRRQWQSPWVVGIVCEGKQRYGTWRIRGDWPKRVAGARLGNTWQRQGQAGQNCLIHHVSFFPLLWILFHVVKSKLSYDKSSFRRVNNLTSHVYLYVRYFSLILSLHTHKSNTITAHWEEYTRDNNGL